jgi:rubredoxin
MTPTDIQWVCPYCGEQFLRFDEETRLSQCEFCEAEFDDSNITFFLDKEKTNFALDPDNRCCPTCERTDSFLDRHGQYLEGRADVTCPQRDRPGKARAYPCEAYVRAVKAVGYDFSGVNLDEPETRYLRSFGLTV